MSNATQQLLDICESLPEDKQMEVMDFARFLLARQQDEAWERTIADGKPRPRLDAFLRESKVEDDQYRAIGERDGGTITWVWIGSHNEFDNLFN